MVMTAKDKFTEEEWNSLLRTPLLVSYAVAGSAPSGKEGFTQEMSAVADAIIEGGEGAAQDSLLGSVVAEIISNAEDEHRGQTEKLSTNEAREKALENCRTVAGILKAKASPEESDEYKRWVIQVAYKVASAAKEGGFLGFGGEQVSGREVEIINELGAAIEV
jgi:hypothetical protein